jgi:hypothetical protein
MDVACSTQAKDEKFLLNFGREKTRKGSDHMRNLGVNGMILKDQGVKVSTLHSSHSG